MSSCSGRGSASVVTVAAAAAVTLSPPAPTRVVPQQAELWVHQDCTAARARTPSRATVGPLDPGQPFALTEH